ncbi:MAG TPA: phospholipase D-like domain-containing protein [Cyclobacteriaceae bacterium]|nr:phospholipase D-like domain-containing protein [Cyclobacteriaceae bacterium]
MNREPLALGTGYTAHNTIELVSGGSAYFDLLVRLIDEAKESIHLQIYIYEADETGTRITEALMRAAWRGVKVYMLLDGYASRSLEPEMIVNIRKAGIYFRWFEPLFKSSRFYIGRRMHHKVFVADGLHSLVGGINISNHYNDRPEQPAWLDWAVYVKGQISTDLHNRCVQMWFRSQKKSALLSAMRTPFNEGPDCYIRMRINDWVRNRNQISRSYLEMFHRAQSQITILSSYFLPGRVFRNNLTAASKRGVKIRLVLTKLSDVALAKSAERFFYPWLLRRNIEIYEYRKKVLHGKIATYDGQWLTIGSYNFNNISAYASLELNLDVHSQRFAHRVDNVLEEIILRDCDPVTTESFAKKTNLFDTFIYRLSYESVRFIFFIFTFYFKREKN